MSKYLKMRFTGNAVLTPDYPDDLANGPAIPGPLYAIMPGARRRRKSAFDGQQIDAQFAFVIFDNRQLMVDGTDDRRPDYKYLRGDNTELGVCFLERENVLVTTGPTSDSITFVNGNTSGFPNLNSSETQRIARWKDFAFKRAYLKPHVLEDPTTISDYVRVIMPGGQVASGYISNQIAKVDFDFYQTSTPAAYAQEIVVTIPFEDSAQNVTLSCTPFPGSAEKTTSLTFIWGGRPSIDLLFGNGSMASLQSVLDGSIAGRDHEGDYDVEFEVLYDIIDCTIDGDSYRPLPHIRSAEILRIPCISSMIGQQSGDSSTDATPARKITPRTNTAVAGSGSEESPSTTPATPATTTVTKKTDRKPRTLQSQGRQRRQR